MDPLHSLRPVEFFACLERPWTGERPLSNHEPSLIVNRHLLHKPPGLILRHGWEATLWCQQRAAAGVCGGEDLTEECLGNDHQRKKCANTKST